MVALELAAVSKRYGRRTALSDVNLVVPEGACLGLLGPNGAGKTTALRILLGFTCPSSGSARLRGRDPFDAAARQGVGYLPERLSLPRTSSVIGLLRLHGALAGLRGAGLEREVERVLDATGLGERALDSIAGLSKGLAQRVGFAQAFLAAPALLMFDEPTSGLDPIGVRDARDWIRGARERGATVLVSSHILSEVERICDHVVILDEGRIAASGTLDDLVRPGESLEDAFVRTLRR